MGRSFRPRRPQPAPRKSQQEVDDLVRSMRKEADSTDNYRARALKLHGWTCAKCGREFEQHNLYLLTVHHKDGNHHHNPPGGSNWENLCAYCHEDEHSRSLLGDYLSGEDEA